ncbi:TOM1-like protein 1 [Engystomops pustulosus]|uniref:TOM1-like protein 1 n=1 Tax=Engystomops pustulosus TaxID=76066 RepID=UPI003AFA65A9
MAFGKTVKDPFSTPVGHLIDIHTNSTNKSLDWGQFMNICDVINSSPDGPKDAVKALKRRLGKNYNQKEVRFTLSLLEMCMQNCNTTFQSMVLRKEFCKDVLAKLLNPKYNLPMDLQNMILRFIMTWATQSPGSVYVTEVKELYLEMIKKGIQFPSLDGGGETSAEAQRVEKPNLSDCPTQMSTQQLSPEQIGKLYSELDMVRMNINVMSEIMLENSSGAELEQDMELLQELEKVCREMQGRILQLLEIVQNEDVIIELVQVNDDLNNIFLRHTRFLRSRSNHLPNNRQENGAIGVNQPSAPLSELIEIDPTSRIQNQTNGFPPEATAAVTPPAVLNGNPHKAPIDAGQPPPPYDNTGNFMYPQMDLLELKEAVNIPFPYGGQNQLLTVPPRNLYDNAHLPPTIQPAGPFFPMVPGSTPFFPLPRVLPPVPISTPPGPTETNPSLFPAVPTLNPTVVPLPKESSTKPSVKSDAGSGTPLPNYYELLEFDPLADSNKTEAIYEEIDTVRWNSKKTTR